MTEFPYTMRWDGEALRPVASAQALCRAEFETGQKYMIAREHGRSDLSHKHFFATVHLVWQTLPDDVGEQFRNADELRYWLLIKAGFCTKTDFVCESPEKAQALVGWLPRGRKYHLLEVRGCVLTRWEPTSQAKKSMNGKTFQESKSALFDMLGDLIGCTGDEVAAMGKNDEPQA